MKKLIIIIICLFTFTVVKSQRFHVVQYYNWSSNTSFNVSPSPWITGYGVLSDSLSSIYGGKFYEYNGEYYPINSWADYYNWYVKKFWYYFNDPGLYEYFYLIGDDFGMAQYICGANYYGWKYPSRIAVTFPGRDVYINNLSRYRIRRCIKTNDWTNKYYVAEIKRNGKRRNNSNINLIKDRRTRNVVANNNSRSQNGGIKRNRNEVVKDNKRVYRNSSTNSRNTSSRNYTNSSVNRNNSTKRTNSSSLNRSTNSSSRNNSKTNNSNRNNSTTSSKQTRSSRTIKSR